MTQHLLLQRVGLIAALGLFFYAGYFGVASATDATAARELSTAWDGHIPFVAETVWIYLAIFPFALCPLFLVRCPWLILRGALAYAFVIAVSLLCFFFFPVTSAGLRVPPEALDVSNASPWAVSVLYHVDPPFNLFPSLHLSIASLATFLVWKAWRSMGAILFVCFGLVAISVTTTKQHFLLDVLGGVVLAVIAIVLFLGPTARTAMRSRRFSWRGPALYVALVAVMYGSFFVAFYLRE